MSMTIFYYRLLSMAAAAVVVANSIVEQTLQSMIDASTIPTAAAAVKRLITIK